MPALKGLRFQGVNSLDYRPFIPAKDECLTEAKLNQISRDLTAAYLKIRLIHTPFSFEESNGELVWVVKEGRILKLESDSKRLNLATLLPNKQGKLLKMQDLDQANKMRGSRASVDVMPFSDGTVDLRFSNQERRRIQGNIGVNNFASGAYHRCQAKGGVSVDSPFGLSDVLFLNLVHSLNGLTQYSRFASLYYSLPYGYWSFNAFGSFSQYRQQITLPHSQVEQRGRTVQGQFSIDYVLTRGSNYVTTLTARLERFESKNRFGEAMIRLQSPKLTAYQLSASHLQLFPNGAMSANLAYKHGLPWFNALPNQGRDQPEGQYGKWMGELYIQYDHQIYQQRFKQSHHLQGQYSRHYLSSSEQADLTGRYAVRGLNHLVFSAEKSLVLRNQLAWLTYLNRITISPYWAVDLGVAKNSGNEAVSKRAIGYALGINIEKSERWNVRLEWASGRLKTEQNRSALKQHNLDFSLDVFF